MPPRTGHRKSEQPHYTREEEVDRVSDVSFRNEFEGKPKGPADYGSDAYLRQTADFEASDDKNFRRTKTEELYEMRKKHPAELGSGGKSTAYDDKSFRVLEKTSNSSSQGTSQKSGAKSTL